MSPSTLPSTCKSSLPEISPLTCRLAPNRAEPPGVVGKGRIASVLMVLPSTDGATGLTGLVSGPFDGPGTDASAASPSAFLFPHIGPPRSAFLANNARLDRGGRHNSPPFQIGAIRYLAG